MNNEYVIINKTEILKRIEELEDMKDDPDKLKDPRDWSFVCGQLDILNFLLSQSTPLIPEIEKAFTLALTIAKHIHKDREDYITNLKLDI